MHKTEYEEYVRKNKQRIALYSYSYIFDGPLRQIQNSSDLYYFFNDDSNLPVVFRLAFVFIPLAHYGARSNMDEFFTEEHVTKYREQIKKIANMHNVTININDGGEKKGLIGYFKKC